MTIRHARNTIVAISICISMIMPLLLFSCGDFICPNGAPSAGAPNEMNHVVSCSACDDGYYLLGWVCITCDEGYVLDDDHCRPVRYTCSGGTAADGAPHGGNSDVENCAHCNDDRNPAGAYCLAYAKLLAADGIADDWFGNAVAISRSGNRAIVGALFESDIGSNSEAGAAYIFGRAADGNWSMEAKLTADDRDAGDRFGNAVAIDGDGERVIVGAYQNDRFLSNAGSAYIFARADDGTWTAEQTIAGIGTTVGDQFGVSVAMDDGGDRVIAGAHRNGNSGSVYIFTRSGSAWTEEQKITVPRADIGAQVGRAVDIDSDGSRVVIGAHRHDDGAVDSGTAYIFSRTGSRWTEESMLTARDGAAGDGLGWSVAIGGNGDRAIIGGFLDEDSGNMDSVAVYIFTRNSDGEWNEEARLIAADTEKDDRFGSAVAISANGDRAIIGAPHDEYADSFTGAVYTFARDDDGWSDGIKITAKDRVGGEAFGGSVAISGDDLRLIIGADLDDIKGVDSGSAYIFDVP